MRSRDRGKRQGETVGRITVRAYEAEDREQLLQLDKTVWERERSPEWVEWKYAENPYVDHTPIFVAETDGEIVGARPLMAFRMRAGEDSYLALQPADTMVHPDHRRQGVFTRMNNRAIERYEDSEAAFFFNFPNEQARPGYRKLGWRAVGERPTYYRVQNPAAFCEQLLDRPTGRFFERFIALAARGYNRARALSSQPSGEYGVVRRSGVPVGLLVSLYERRIPERIHALRDERFYQWRFASPAWTRTTYVATRDDTPVAAVIARTRTTADGKTVTQFAEVVPLVGGSGWVDALSYLFKRVVRDHPRSDLFAVASTSIPHDLLTTHGFLPDDRWPLIWARSHHHATVVRPLDDELAEECRLGKCRLTNERDWLLSYGERDTA